MTSLNENNIHRIDTQFLMYEQLLCGAKEVN